MSYVQNSRSGYLYTSSFWILTQTLGVQSTGVDLSKILGQTKIFGAKGSNNWWQYRHF